MSNASLKEQLEAVASKLSDAVEKVEKKVEKQVPSKKKPQPAVESSRKAKPKWLEYVQYGVELLKVYFPDCFKIAPEIKPLKKGIKQDLVKRLSAMDGIVTEDKACMLKSLTYYVNTAAYHKSVIEGVARIDLDGNAVGMVSAEEAKYSVDRHQAKLQAKRQLPPNHLHNECKEPLSQ